VRVEEASHCRLASVFFKSPEEKFMKIKVLRSLVIVMLVVLVVGIGVAAQAPQAG
jgi:hypothetical protein